jgi:hypothetical protein
MSAPEWEGRAIRFADFDIATGEAVIEAAQKGETHKALYLTLVASARYVDDDRPVFASVEDLRSHPFRLLQRVQTLAALAGEHNKIFGEPQAPAAGPLFAADADVPASAGAGDASNGRGA